MDSKTCEEKAAECSTWRCTAMHHLWICEQKPFNKQRRNPTEINARLCGWRHAPQMMHKPLVRNDLRKVLFFYCYYLNIQNSHCVLVVRILAVEYLFFHDLLLNVFFLLILTLWSYNHSISFEFIDSLNFSCLFTLSQNS